MGGLAIISDRRLWLTADKTRVVEDGDQAAAFLFASEGGEISTQDAGRFGLAVEDGRILLLRETQGDEVENGAGDEDSDEGAGGEAGTVAGDEAGGDAGEGAGADSAAKKDSARNKKK